MVPHVKILSEHGINICYKCVFAKGVVISKGKLMLSQHGQHQNWCLPKDWIWIDYFKMKQA